MNEWYAPQRTHAARPKWPRECFTSLVSVRQGHRAVIDKSAIYLPNAEIKCTKWFLIALPPNQSHPRHRPTVQLGSIIIRMQWKCAELQIATNKINGKQKHLKFMLIAIWGGGGGMSTQSTTIISNCIFVDQPKYWVSNILVDHHRHIQLTRCKIKIMSNCLTRRRAKTKNRHHEPPVAAREKKKIEAKTKINK